MGLYPYDDDASSPNIAIRETFLGRSASHEIAFIGGPTTSWSQINTTFAASLRTQFTQKPLEIALPLTATGTTLASVAGGSNDADFTSAFTQILSLATWSGEIKIRLGHEMNLATTYPWKSHGVEANYIAAFQRVVGLGRAVSSRFKFVFCPLALDAGVAVYNWQSSYPGDAYVDIVSLDYYFYASGFPNLGISDTAANIWSSYARPSAGGFDEMATFARARGKRLAISELGFIGDATRLDPWAGAIPLMADWARAVNVEYIGYWMSNAGGASANFIYGAQPLAGAAFVSAFGVAH